MQWDKELIIQNLTNDHNFKHLPRWLTLRLSFDNRRSAGYTLHWAESGCTAVYSFCPLLLLLWSESLCYESNSQRSLQRCQWPPLPLSVPKKESLKNNVSCLLTDTRLYTCTYCPCWGTSGSSVHYDRLFLWNKRPKRHFNGLYSLSSIFKKAGAKWGVFHPWSQNHPATQGQKTHPNVSWLGILQQKEELQLSVFSFVFLF